MVAPAALYTALGWFHRWLTKGHTNLLSMQWLQEHSANNQASFSYVQNNMALVSLAISLGTPIPHARYLKEDVTDYADAGVWGDSLLKKAENGSTSWKATHDQVAAELASIASGGGVPATAVKLSQTQDSLP